MSELKVYRDPKEGSCWREFYEKSEADKVIADKDAEIAELKEQIQKERSAKVDYKISAHDLSDGLKEAYEDLWHQKYKRCLTMATVCFEKSYSTTLVKYDKKSDLFRNFYDWWGNRWLELAERFKEKPTW